MRANALPHPVHIVPRWVAFVVALLLYIIRVWVINGWYIVTYGLGIFLLNLLIGFLSPAIDPAEALADADDGFELPTSNDAEFRPFTRRVPEFKAWHSGIRAIVVSFLMTFFSIFDIPVFWPILLIYFFVLFFLTMRQRIAHMLKHKYVPWDWGKKASYNKGGGGKGGKE